MEKPIKAFGPPRCVPRAPLCILGSRVSPGPGSGPAVAGCVALPHAVLIPASGPVFMLLPASGGSFLPCPSSSCLQGLPPAGKPSPVILTPSPHPVTSLLALLLAVTADLTYLQLDL